MARAIRMERVMPAGTQRKLLDFQLGYALLCDRRVPVRRKVVAFAIGAAIVAALGALELPLEEVMAFVLPILGAFVDIALDGAEAIFGPLMLAILLLPYLAPSEIVEQVLRERSGVAPMED